jgi:hypothetical protein
MLHVELAGQDHRCLGLFILTSCQIVPVWPLNPSTMATSPPLSVKAGPYQVPWPEEQALEMTGSWTEDRRPSASEKVCQVSPPGVVSCSDYD